MSYANPDALVTTEWLAGNLENENVVVLDASFYLPAANRNGGEEFLTQHIPGARYFNVETIADSSSGLPQTAPSPEFFAEKAAELGVSNSSKVVTYDASGGAMAGMRAWWMFRLYGHDNVSVLSGGLPKWLAEDRPTESGVADVTPGEFVSHFRPELIRSVDQVLGNIESGEAQVIDVRAPGRFDGSEPEPREGMRSGHIPGAVNLPFGKLLDADNYNVMRPAGELKELLSAVTRSSGKPIITSCGSGVTAAVATLALHLIGRDDVAIYDGSWSEWGGRQDTPVETS